MPPVTVIGLVGRIRSGKSSAAEWYVREHGGACYRNSQILEGILTILGMEHTRSHLSRLGVSLFREFGEDLLAKGVLRKIRSTSEDTPRPRLIVIDGIRFLAEVELYRSLPSFRLVCVSADPETRYRRAVAALKGARADELGLTFDEFLAQERASAERDAEALEAQADFVILNNETAERLGLELDRVLSAIHGDK